MVYASEKQLSAVKALRKKAEQRLSEFPSKRNLVNKFIKSQRRPLTKKQASYFIYSLKEFLEKNPSSKSVFQRGH